MKRHSTPPVSQLNLPSLPEGGVTLTDLEAAKISEVAAEVMRLTARGVNVFLHTGQIVVLRVQSPSRSAFVDAFNVGPTAGVDVLARCDSWLNQLANVERDLAGWPV
jgi:hypothetical protein